MKALAPLAIINPLSIQTNNEFLEKKVCCMDSRFPENNSSLVHALLIDLLNALVNTKGKEWFNQMISVARPHTISRTTE